MLTTKETNRTNMAHTRVNSQGIVTKPRILLHSSMEATTSLSTYLNKVTATSIINIMNSIMAARKILPTMDSKMTTSAIRSHTPLTMPRHMVRIRVHMVDMDTARNMGMGMDMVVQVSENWMMERR